MTDPVINELIKMYDKGPELTKRELFAALAMQGFISNPETAKDVQNNVKGAGLTDVVQSSVIAADALIKELSRDEDPR